MALKVLISGCNRGLGLELVRQYVAAGDEVLAVVRRESEELAAVQAAAGARLRVYKCDLSDFHNLDALKAQVGDEPLDVVLCNAGMLPPYRKCLETTNEELAQYQLALTVNVVSPFKMASLFAPNLLAKRDGLRKLVFMTSRMGSIGDNQSGGAAFYRATKAALNAQCFGLKYEFPELTVILQHPGWVRTDMGGPNGLIDAPTSVAGIRHIIETCTKSGVFIDYAGNEIPW